VTPPQYFEIVSLVVCRPPTFGLSRSLEENDLARMIGVALREPLNCV
jgi:hypothetical protein